MQINIHYLWKIRNVFLHLRAKLSMLDCVKYIVVNELCQWIYYFALSIKSHCKTEENSYARKQGRIHNYIRKYSFTLEEGDNYTRMSFPFWLSRNYSTRSHSNLSAKNTPAFVTSGSILQFHVKESRDNSTFAWKSCIADKNIDTPNISIGFFETLRKLHMERSWLLTLI